MLVDKARKFVAGVEAESRQLACRAIRGLQSELEKQKIKLTRCGLLLASGKSLPQFEKILASHALIHTADGELFREAILHACARCRVKAECIKEKELLQNAREALRMQPAALMRRVTELGRDFGSPWSQDEKFATLVAWLSLIS
jgi:hypothetical protein